MINFEGFIIKNKENTWGFSHRMNPTMTEDKSTGGLALPAVPLGVRKFENLLTDSVDDE